MPNIANNIRRLRFEHQEMTQEDLAKAVGCTRQTIIALEQGKYVPSIELAFKISRVFQSNIEEVFRYEG
jgi:putative transcriptional regulator